MKLSFLAINNGKPSGNGMGFGSMDLGIGEVSEVCFCASALYLPVLGTHWQSDNDPRICETRFKEEYKYMQVPT